MRSLALVAAALLAGCSFAPDHVRPALPTAPAYPADVRPDAAGPRAADIGWRGFFPDPYLQALIATALDNNRDLRVSVARIEEARGQYRIQRADRLPTVNVGTSATRSRVGAGGIAGPTTGAPGADPTDGVNPTGGSTTFNRYDIAATVTSFELDFWGRVRSLSEAARAEYLATVAAERAFRISLVADVASLYLIDRELAERIALAERTLGSRREGLAIAKLRLDAGVTSALDYRQVETLLTQAETELASVQRQRAQNRNGLVLLLGGPLEATPPPARALAAQGIAENLTAGLPSELLVRRPDILAAEERLRAAGANIGAARAAFFPTISLTGSLGFASDSLDGLFGSDGFTWSFGPSLLLPIFDAGRNRANLDVAFARRDIAVATYESTVQVAFREVADALAARRWLADQFAAQSRAIVAQRDRAELANLRYSNGVADYLEVLDAQRELFAAEQLLVQTRREQLSNAVSLYAALGGGLTP